MVCMVPEVHYCSELYYSSILRIRKAVAEAENWSEFLCTFV